MLLVDDASRQTTLVHRAAVYLVLHRPFRQETISENTLRLTVPVASIDRLEINRWIPMTIEKNDAVGGWKKKGKEQGDAVQ